jgi:NRAMP (natural resistance-associated macrophage protein)-like metal ion transporter
MALAGSPLDANSRSPTVGPSKPRLLGVLGPGLITGASDDDPSGIATYSQAGAQFGYSVSWMMVFTYPLMAVVQEVSGRLGRTTGLGIAGNMRKHYPAWQLQMLVVLLCLANTINIGADLGAMGDAMSLLIGGPSLLYILAFGALCATLQIYMQYTRYVSVLKWLCLALFAYFGTAMVVHIPWGEAVHGMFIPTFSSDGEFWTMVVAIPTFRASPCRLGCLRLGRDAPLADRARPPPFGSQGLLCSYRASHDGRSAT